MPKPVLSDSLFNADDVATAVLAEANLQISNSDLGVVDRSSIFVSQTDITVYRKLAFSFMGFMFVNLEFNHPSPSGGQNIFIINDSDYFPTVLQSWPSIGYNTDSAQSINLTTDGVMEVISPYNASGGWNGLINGWYRFV